MVNHARSISEKVKERKETTLETIACDLCGSSQTTVVFSCNGFPDDIAEPQNVVRCNECSLLFTCPRPGRDAVTRLYQKYYLSNEHAGNGNSFIRRHPALRRLWHLFCGQYLGYVLKKATGRVLEIGCGTGGLLEELSLNGCEPHGIELNPDSVEICRKKGLDVRAGDLNDFDFDENYFDAIVLWHVIEHVPSPTTTMEKIRKILKPGGAVYLFAPNAGSYLARIFGDKWFPWQIPFHFYHFTPRTFRAISQKCNFTVTRLKAVTPEYYLAYSYDLWEKSKLGKKRSALIMKIMNSFYFRISIAVVFRILDVVFYGQGECLQIELTKPLS
jgi:2-polyprenyl-3-methyl-5-hydroxy-6-metoxy-1,4-benzoquinol methylase